MAPNFIKKVVIPIQIHHIKPLKYGGKSVNSNLIPLPKATHTQFTTWWAQY